jgi:large subunit ribosomal protein L25
MSDVKQLKAVARDRAGKGAARAVRRQGQVPAVIYGGGAPAQMIALDFNTTKQLIFAGHFLTTVFEIDVDGQVTRAIPRDYQLDPVKDFPVHIDFLRVAAGQTVTVEVPVHVVGQERSPGMKGGGALNLVRHTIELVVPADAIPDFVEADVSALDFNDSLHISAVKLPDGARPAITDRDFTILSITAPAGARETAGESAEAAPAA